MMKRVVSKSIPAAVAFSHIRETLRVGGVVAENSEVRGLMPENIFALVPEDTEDIRLLDCTHGGLLQAMPKFSDGPTTVQFVPSTAFEAAEITFKQLALCDRPTLWIHEPLLTEGQLEAKGLPYVSVAGATYLVYADSLDVSRLAELIRYSLLSWHFLRLSPTVSALWIRPTTFTAMPSLYWSVRTMERVSCM